MFLKKIATALFPTALMLACAGFVGAQDATSQSATAQATPDAQQQQEDHNGRDPPFLPLAQKIEKLFDDREPVHCPRRLVMLSNDRRTAIAQPVTGSADLQVGCHHVIMMCRVGVSRKVLFW